MKRFFYFSLFVLFFVMQDAFAGPAYWGFFTVKQSNGELLTVRKCGDEHFSYYMTKDGVPLSKNISGDFCYAEFTQENELRTTEVLAQNKDKRNAMEQTLVEGLNKELYYSEVYTKAMRSNAYQAQAPISSKGAIDVPVLLVEFSDQKFSMAEPIDFFTRHLNADNYTEEGGVGSAREYFLDQSNGAFRPTFSVVKKVTLSRRYYYYGTNRGNAQDVYANLMVQEAINEAKNNGADFSKFSSNSLCIIYAGIGEEYMSSSDSCIWSKTFPNTSFTANDGKIFNSASLVCELNSKSVDGIGTFCHEFTHLLGFPDMYGASGAFGLDYYSLMDYGNFWNNGKSPIGYTAYERYYMGWVEPVVLSSEKQLVVLNSLGKNTENTVYKIPNAADATGNEYYLLENRQPNLNRWFPSKIGSGMLVFHIDFNQLIWNQNTPNGNAKHQRVTIIPADNVLVIDGKSNDYKGDFYPGLTSNTSLTDFSVPSDTAWTGSHMGIKMNDISEKDGVITFAYMADGILLSPDTIRTTHTSSSSITLEWDAVDNAEYYDLTLSDGSEIVASYRVLSPLCTVSSLKENHNYNVTLTAKADAYIDSSEKTVAFSTTILDGIDSVLSLSPNETVSVYTIDGVLIDRAVSVRSLSNGYTSGIYIIKAGDKTFRANIR